MHNWTLGFLVSRSVETEAILPAQSINNISERFEPPPTKAESEPKEDYSLCGFGRWARRWGQERNCSLFDPKLGKGFQPICDHCVCDL
jgi:hypothetical protein